jgi:hypothetical protein
MATRPEMKVLLREVDSNRCPVLKIIAQTPRIFDPGFCLGFRLGSPWQKRIKCFRSLAGQANKVDIWIITATHRNLQAMIEDGTFREDLITGFQ